MSRPRPAPRIWLNHAAAICAAGKNLPDIADALAVGSMHGMPRSAHFTAERELTLGRVDDRHLPAADSLSAPFRSRNNRLLAAALEPLRAPLDALRARHAPQRIAVVIGTSTSGVGETEMALAARMRDGALPADYEYAQHELASPAMWLRQTLGLQGPAWTVSTACSSGAKALASAARLLRAGLADAVVAGGADALCGLTVAGFAALEAVSGGRCNPLSANRDGINLGEAAALFVVSREAGPVALSGWGESSDAYHVSAPDPRGIGALRAMRRALAVAGRDAAEIGYVNLHGTATRHNDAMESRAIAQIFGDRVPVSSTKPMTGHTLGAAGALEAAICWQLLSGDGRLPAHCWDGVFDPELPPLQVVDARAAQRLDRGCALSNSFAFGGSNVALVLEAA